MPAVPSELVDAFWHAHILDTRRYADDYQLLSSSKIRRSSASLAFICELRLQNGERLRLEIGDVSQSGLGLRSNESDIRRLPIGTVLRGCKLELGQQRLQDITLQVAGCGLQWQGRSVMHTLGCAFVLLTLHQQTLLQRLVYQIERARRQ
nr:PilZ domain-containing protein [Cupriavidus sp. IK-TO18]